MVEPRRKLGEKALLDANSELKSAFAALHAGDPEEAALRFSAALQQDAADAQVCAALGLSLTCAGEDEAGLQLLERAHYLEPGNARFLFLYGLALEKAGRVTQARLRYEGVLRLAPDLERVRQRLSALPDPLILALERLQHRALAPPFSPQTVQPPAAETQASFAGLPAVPAAHLPDYGAPPTDSTEPVGLQPLIPASPPAEPTPPEPVAFDPLAFQPATSPANARASSKPRAHTEEELSPIWAPPLPGLLALAREAVLLWMQRPLVWMGLFALPNLAGAFTPFMGRGSALEEGLLWVAAFGIGAALALRPITAHFLHGRPLAPRQLLSSRLLQTAALTLLYSAVVLGPALAVALRLALPPAALLLGVLLLTAPFHVLIAPALVLSVEGPSAAAALRGGARVFGRRTWLHLGVMLVTGVALGGLLAVLGWGLAVTLRPEGDVVPRLLQIAGVSAGESLWAALVTVCGHDALAASPSGLNPSPDPDKT